MSYVSQGRSDALEDLKRLCPAVLCNRVNAPVDTLLTAGGVDARLNALYGDERRIRAGVVGHGQFLFTGGCGQQPHYHKNESRQAPALGFSRFRVMRPITNPPCPLPAVTGHIQVRAQTWSRFLRPGTDDPGVSSA